MKNKKIGDSLVCSCTWNLKLSLFSVWIWIFHVMKVSAFAPPSPIWPTTVLERSTEPECSLRSATSSAQVRGTRYILYIYTSTGAKNKIFRFRNHHDRTTQRDDLKRCSCLDQPTSDRLSTFLRDLNFWIFLWNSPHSLVHLLPTSDHHDIIYISL